MKSFLWAVIAVVGLALIGGGIWLSFSDASPATHIVRQDIALPASSR